MSDDLRAKLRRNTMATPAKRTAETFVSSPARTSRNNARTTFYLPDDVRRGLKLAAADRGTTVNNLVLEAIDEYARAHPDIARWLHRDT